jgi:hypothetical protein
MPSKFEENRSKDKRMFNHARARTRALARVRAMREHEQYVAHTTSCDLYSRELTSEVYLPRLCDLNSLLSVKFTNPMYTKYHKMPVVCLPMSTCNTLTICSGFP